MIDRATFTIDSARKAFPINFIIDRRAIFKRGICSDISYLCKLLTLNIIFIHNTITSEVSDKNFQDMKYTKLEVGVKNH